MKYTIILACLLLPIFVLAQPSKTDVQIDERLYEVFDEPYLERLLIERPFLIQRWNFYLDNAYYLTKDDKAERNDYPVIKVTDLENINIFQLERAQGLRRHPIQEMSYQIADSEWVLIYHSAATFTEQLNAHLGRTHPSN